jgi:L-malate glycosyltransferase
MRVHQVLCAAGQFDAITEQSDAYRRLLTDWDMQGGDFAPVVDPRLNGRVRPLAALKPARDDVLVLHYSGYVRELDQLAALPNRKLLVYHNITPARYFWDYEPTVALQCAAGREQLAELARSFDVVAGVSEYNAEELRSAGAPDARVIPVLFDRRRLPQPADPPERPTILFVGRLAPHKRQDQVLRAFALYRRHRAPDARLVLVGSPLNPAFGRALEGMAAQLAPGAVTFETDLAPQRLWDRYREAGVFLCLSEHEGFCIPLLEAFHFGVPVVARPAGGIPEVAGDAALLTDDQDLAVVSELLDLAVNDRELRAELARRAQKRLDAYPYDGVADRVREAIVG